MKKIVTVGLKMIIAATGIIVVDKVKEKIKEIRKEAK